jgi:hypothetical protein
MHDIPPRSYGVARLADPLALPHYTFSGVEAEEDTAALVRRRGDVSLADPARGRSHLRRRPGAVRRADRPTGPGSRVRPRDGRLVDAWWLDESQVRQDAVRGLLAHVNDAQDKQAPLLICGDFNADPDSDEIRMISGRTAAPEPGLSFGDAWEVAGAATPVTPGPTTIRGRPSCGGPAAGSTTSSRSRPDLAAPVTRCTPTCWEPVRSTTCTRRTTTPFRPTFAIEPCRQPPLGVA